MRHIIRTDFIRFNVVKYDIKMEIKKCIYGYIRNLNEKFGTKKMAIYVKFFYLIAYYVILI